MTFFPTGGVPAKSTLNAYTPVIPSACTPKYYRSNSCRPTIDAIALNGHISQTVCLIDKAGLALNCDDPCQTFDAVATIAAEAAAATALKSCGGATIVPGTAVATCADLAAAISTAINGIRIPGPPVWDGTSQIPVGCEVPLGEYSGNHTLQTGTKINAAQTPFQVMSPGSAATIAYGVWVVFGTSGYSYQDGFQAWIVQRIG
jgi:hypothetical protein